MTILMGALIVLTGLWTVRTCARLSWTSERLQRQGLRRPVERETTEPSTLWDLIVPYAIIMTGIFVAVLAILGHG
jgi:hypothetical protein